MYEKPADKLISGQGHDFPLGAVFVIAPFEDNHAVFRF